MRFGTFVELFTPAVFSRGHKRSPPHLHAALQICVPEAPVQRSRFNNILPGFNCWQSNIVKESPPICRCMSYWKRTICMTISVLLGKQLPIGLLKAQSERNHSTQQIWSLRVKAALYTRKYHIYIYIYKSLLEALNFLGFPASFHPPPHQNGVEAHRWKSPPVADHRGQFHKVPGPHHLPIMTWTFTRWAFWGAYETTLVFAEVLGKTHDSVDLSKWYLAEVNGWLLVEQKTVVLGWLWSTPQLLTQSGWNPLQKPNVWKVI